MTTAPHSPLVEQVAQAMHTAGHEAGFFNFPWEKVAEHGREKYGVLAEAALKASHAEELIRLLRECSEDLAAEVIDRYTQNGEVHPAYAEKYARDMTPVMNARALLAKLDGRS